jgi:acylphosphatase
LGDSCNFRFGYRLATFDFMKYLRARVIIHGFVQGVAFRASTRNQAERLGIGGWVRNLSDGTVEALFEGELKKVEEMVAWCHRGPLGAHVTEVEIVRGPHQGEYHYFAIRYDR